MIGVLRYSAAHAAGVVGEDAAHAATGDRGRIGADLPAIKPQRVVGLLADQAGLHADGLAVLLDAYVAPVAADIDENAVGDRLAGEAGAAGAEDQRNLMLVAEAEEMLDLFRSLGLDDRAGESGDRSWRPRRRRCAR